VEWRKGEINMAGERVKNDARAARIQDIIDDLQRTLVRSTAREIKALPAPSDKCMDLVPASKRGLVSPPRTEIVAPRASGKVIAPPPMPMSTLLAALDDQPRRIDLPRKCAVHKGEPWVAVYIRQADGSYKYSDSVRVTPEMQRWQYAPGTQKIVELDNKWLEIEKCGVCGVTVQVPAARGSFYCGGCGHSVCGGLSNGLYFRCFCGTEGWAKPTRINHTGIGL
jgi:hypothetical protein